MSDGELRKRFFGGGCVLGEFPGSRWPNTGGAVVLAKGPVTGITIHAREKRLVAFGPHVTLGSTHDACSH